jgi:hypothetical protein
MGRVCRPKRGLNANPALTFPASRCPVQSNKGRPAVCLFEPFGSAALIESAELPLAGLCHGRQALIVQGATVASPELRCTEVST